MQKKNTLYLGFGDLARRVRGLLGAGDRDLAVCRGKRATAGDPDWWQAPADDRQTLALLRGKPFANVVLTLTPQAMTEQAYHQAYVAPMQALVPLWLAQPPERLLFVSSTGVYGQTAGEWVDETSPCRPGHFSGQALLAAEELLRTSGLAHTVVRLAGIYGPGRDWLLRQVAEGKGGDASYTNRIHVDDAAGFIAALLREPRAGAWAQSLFNVCDNEPASGTAVRQWLAEQMGGVDLQPTPSPRGGNKRVANTRLRATGFKLQYPDFRVGYRALLAAWQATR